MTARKVKEWIGKAPDSPVPKRVKLRILARQKDCCAGCGISFDARTKPIFDHRPALCNGGENRENRIEAICWICHAPRTKADVAEKKVTNRMKAGNLGFAPRKSRPMPGTKASGIRKRMNGLVERWT